MKALRLDTPGDSGFSGALGGNWQLGYETHLDLSVINIGVSIGFEIDLMETHVRLFEVRELRNVVAGHPSRGNSRAWINIDGKELGRKIIYHTFLSRSNLWKDSFEVTKSMRSGSVTTRHFLPEVIKYQLVGAAELLKKLAEEIERRFPVDNA